MNIGEKSQHRCSICGTLLTEEGINILKCLSCNIDYTRIQKESGGVIEPQDMDKYKQKFRTYNQIQDALIIINNNLLLAASIVFYFQILLGYNGKNCPHCGAVMRFRHAKNFMQSRYPLYENHSLFLTIRYTNKIEVFIQCIACRSVFRLTDLSKELPFTDEEMDRLISIYRITDRNGKVYSCNTDEELHGLVKNGELVWSKLIEYYGEKICLIPEWSDHQEIARDETNVPDTSTFLFEVGMTRYKKAYELRQLKEKNENGQRNTDILAPPNFKEQMYDCWGDFKAISPPVPILPPYHLQLGIVRYGSIHPGYDFSVGEGCEHWTEKDYLEHGFEFIDGCWQEPDSREYYAFCFHYPELYQTYGHASEDSILHTLQLKVLVFDKRTTDITKIDRSLVYDWILYQLNEFQAQIPEDFDKKVYSSIEEVISLRNVDDTEFDCYKSLSTMMINNDPNPKKRLKEEKTRITISNVLWGFVVVGVIFLVVIYIVFV